MTDELSSASAEDLAAAERPSLDAQVSENDWLDAIDPDNSAFARTKGWEDLDAIIRSYQNLESLLGNERAGRTVVLPGGEDDAEALSEIYDRLGRPAAAEGYELERSGAPADEPLLDWYRGIAHDAGLSQRQAAALFDAWGVMAATQAEALNRKAQAERDSTREALREKWGPRYETKLASAQRAVRRFGGDQAAALEQAIGHGAMTEFLARIGEALREDALPAGEGRTGFGLSPEEARNSYNQRKRDPDFVAALQDAAHPGHAAATSERARYLSAIWPVQ
jgi:hypothetical protein